MNWLPSIAAVAMLALGSVLFCLAAVLTLAALWPILSEGFRRAVLLAWGRLRDHVIFTARLYFRRLRWYGHTVPSTVIAVVFSLVIWLAVAASLTFTAYWQISVAALTALPVTFLLVGWWTRGPNAGNHRFNFACSFFEPALALVVPSVGSKLIDIALHALKAAL